MNGQPEIAGLPIGWAAIFGLLNTLGLGAMGVQWIKNRALNRKIELDGDERLRSEMWRDIEALKLSKDNTGRRLTLAETKIAQQQVQIGQQGFVLTLVVTELERVSPGNTVARQAREVMKNIQPLAMPAAEEVASMVESMTSISGDHA